MVKKQRKERLLCMANKLEIKKCPVVKKCGGCSCKGTSYKEQTDMKEKQVRKLLKGICKVEPIVGMENPYHYRNKIHAAFAHLRDGSVVSGNTQREPTESCLWMTVSSKMRKQTPL